MVKKLILLISGIVLVSFNGWCVELNDDAGAKKFINEFLKAEFIGNESFRVDNTINSAKRQQMITKKYKPMIGEIFQWENEELSIVDSFEIKEIKISKQKATVTVMFQEFGRTLRGGYVKNPIIKTNEKTPAKYQLIYKKDRWWLYDPPMPRISRNALIDYNDEKIRRLHEFVLEKGTEIQRKHYYNYIDVNKMLKEK